MKKEKKKKKRGKMKNDRFGESTVRPQRSMVGLFDENEA
jgi:hypothetical protein